MSLLNPQTVVTEQRLADFYAAIYNYLGSIEVDSALSPVSTNPVQNKVVKAALDKWFSNTPVQVSSGSITFTGIDDTQGYGYKVFFEVDGNSTNKNPSAQLSSISGAGTSSMSLTYTTDADNGSNAKLRIIK